MVRGSAGDRRSGREGQALSPRRKIKCIEEEGGTPDPFSGHCSLDRRGVGAKVEAIVLGDGTRDISNKGIKYSRRHEKTFKNTTW